MNTAATPAILIEGASKRFGDRLAVDDASMSVDAGEVRGYLGPNGAGKTTTLRMLMRLLRPDAGTIRIFGRDVTTEPASAFARIGYLPGDLALNRRLTGRETAQWLCQLHNHPDMRVMEDLISRFDFDPDIPVGSMSKGTRQKVGILLAFAHEPDLLILDEPSSGLDPMMQRTFADLVRERASSGAAVLLSSHLLTEVEQIADRVTIINHGKILVTDSVEALRHRLPQRIEFEFDSAEAAHSFAANSGGTVDEIQPTRVSCRFVRNDVDAVVKAAAQHRVLSVDSPEQSLEDAFLSLVEHGEEGSNAR